MADSLNLVRRALFLISTPMVFIMFALPLRAEDLGASGFEIGILYSLFTASLIVLRPLVGIGLDRVGRRPFFIAALTFYFLANALYAASSGLDGLFVARAFQGIGFAILSITADTITADLTEPDGRGEAMGGNIESQARGGMVGAFIGFSLVAAIPIHSWLFSFSTFAITAAIAVIFAVRVIPETLEGRTEDRSRLHFQLPRRYIRLMIIIFLAAFAAAAIQPYYLVYLRAHLGLELQALAFAFLPVGIATAVLPAWLGRATNRMHRVTALTAGLSAAAALYILVPHISAFIWIIIAFTAASVGSVLFDLTKNAWLADIAGPNATGRTFGAAALVAGIGGALGPLAGGAIYDGVGARFVFYFAGAVFLVAVTLLQRYRTQE